MKVLLLVYSDLLKKEDFWEVFEKNVDILSRVIGIDSLYASVSSRFIEIFDRFPEICFINNLKDTPVFGAYKGLRKLRGNDVLIVDGGCPLSKDWIFQLINRVNVTVGMLKQRWAGIALVKMRELDYMVRSLEKNFERSMLEAFHTLKNTYSVVTEFLDVDLK